jgi:DNA-binding winged helix-turn-helix (wHTH) protein
MKKSLNLYFASDMLINDRFEVDRFRGEVTDRQTGTLSRIEPRLMKLLCLLVEHSGKPVSRKLILEEIWNNYPGGDEGINQAISVLRKLLSDNEKRIIETLPKIGYCFHGTTTANPIGPKPKSLKAIYIPILLFLLLIVSFALGYYRRGEASNKIIPGKLSAKESTKAFELDSHRGAIAFKMDSAGKLDSKEGGQPGRTDDQER